VSDPVDCSFVHPEARDDICTWCLISELEVQLKARQVQIDNLMLEYCPEEMTIDQMANWRKYQVPVSPKQQAEIDKALEHSDE
jgi:hypothetical protein